MSEENWVPELDEIFNNMDDIKNMVARIEQKLDSKSAEKFQKKKILYITKETMKKYLYTAKIQDQM
eukprot:SAG11_NODE_39632_length_226_cov_43.574803_1_plen_65_part_10